MANPEIHALARIAVTEEIGGSANFGVDVSGSNTFEDVPFAAGTATMQLDKTMLDPQTTQQYRDGRPKQVVGPARATLNFSIPLAPTGTAADAATAAPADTDAALLLMLRLAYGAISTGQQGSLVATGTNASTFDVTGTEGSQFSVGQAVGIGLAGTAADVEARVIESVTTDTVVLKHELTATPSTSDIVYNSATIYPAESATSAFQFIVEGVSQANRWVLMGGQVTTPPTITVVWGEIPMMTFSLEFADWVQLSNSAITAATYDGFTPVAAVGEFFAQVTGTATPQILDAASVTYAFNSPTYVPQKSPSGKNTIACWVRGVGIPFVEVTFVIPYYNTAPYEETFLTARDTQADYALNLQIGTTAGSIVLIESPTSQITSANEIGDAEQLSSLTVKGEARLDTDTGAQTSELLRAACRIHFL